MTLKNLFRNINLDNILKNISSPRKEEIIKPMDLYHEAKEIMDIRPIYVNCQLYNKITAAMLDTGAQKTIIGINKVKELGLERLVNYTKVSMARGVGGGAVIIGRLENMELKMGSLGIRTDIEVLQDNDMFLVGLDIIAKYQFMIDFEKEVVKVGNQEFKFLRDGQIDSISQELIQKIDLLKEMGHSEELISEVINIHQQNFESAFNSFF